MNEGKKVSTQQFFCVYVVFSFCLWLAQLLNAHKAQNLPVVVTYLTSTIPLPFTTVGVNKAAIPTTHIVEDQCSVIKIKCL
jgi:hypothetical protein